MKHRVILEVIVLLTSMLISGCVSKSGATIDNQDSAVSVNIPQHGLSYEFPYPQRSIVAPLENLPEKVLMCVVDTTADVSIMLLNLHSFPKTYFEAEKTVRQIMRQNDVEYKTSTSCDVRECEFLDTCAWKFDASLIIQASSDSIGVKFYGYFFEDMAFVVTAPTSDSITVENIAPYIKGLKRSGEY